MKRLADQTLYEILEIPPDATGEQVQAAYEKARALYGPGSLVTYTLMEPDEAALLEARIEDARGTLLDPERRARYDASLEEGHGEARAAASGSAAPAAMGPPPVIPAAAASAPSIEPAPPIAHPPSFEPAPPSSPPSPSPSPEPPAARPAILLGAALGAAGKAEDSPPPPRPAPILLQRAIDEEATQAPRAEASAHTRPSEPGTEPASQPDPASQPSTPSATVAPPAARETPPAAAATAGPVVPPPLPDAWTGDALRQVREARGITIQQICERTKITRHHIENIEGDRFDVLPAQVYLRGILLTIARELRLDGQKVARSYLERLGGAAPAGATPKPR